MGNALALRAERRTSDQEVVGSTPARALLCSNLRRVGHTFVPARKQYKLVPM